MDAAKKLDGYTVDDVYALPAGERVELIDGELYLMATPGRIHQRLSHLLEWKIENYIQGKNGDCQVYAASFAVFLSRDERNYLEPDITVVCDKNKLTDRGCEGVPDWVIEIVFPSSRSMDYVRKLYQYQKAGVREYWIADYEKNRIMVYDFEKNDILLYTFSDKIKAGIYDDLEIDFAEFDLG